ncbi:MAG: magnesium transporter CorA family protein [Syntrophaceticus sp.]|nr:magnesium transporter CorA family protein [Syntrophaceticus sp.]HBG22191.1 magnesium transporter [Peptococcaceae bacterium]
MLRVYRTVEEGQVSQEAEICEKAWLSLINPTEEEIQMVSEKTGITRDFLKDPLDDEERPRIEIETGQILIIIKVPVARGKKGAELYDAIPLGIIVTKDYLITVCLDDHPIFSQMLKMPVLFTFKKTRFLLLILIKTATLYLNYLRILDDRSTELQSHLSHTMKNEALLRLLDIQKSLVYFTTSLRANGIVMEKLTRTQLVKAEDAPASMLIKMYPEDEELLEDAITENRQAIEMSSIYSSILTGSMDAYAALISNNMASVMKFLTSVTIVLSLPTIIASIYGMNVGLPFQNSPLAFVGIMGTTFGIAGAAAYALYRWNMF